MTAWQPIETAPKDGSMVITGGPSWSDAGFYHDGSVNYWGKSGWYDECDRGNLLTAKPSMPTHWMPLPAPPPISGAGQNEERR